MPLFLAPPALSQPATRPVPLAEAVGEVLDAWDEGREIPSPKVAARDLPALQWLRNAVLEDHPSNPFAAGSSAHREAAAIRKLLGTPAAPAVDRMRTLPLKEHGSQIALWRWGRARMRAAAWPPTLRKAWEDALLASPAPGLLRGMALRHALCFALAEGDETRFADLRKLTSQDTTALFSAFQRLFALVGGPSPHFRLWPLPAREPLDLKLGDLGQPHVWICPPPPGGPAAPVDAAWILPTREGLTPGNEAHLHKRDQDDAEALWQQLGSQGRPLWLAPSRSEFEANGLAFFPILIDLDKDGNLTRIRMGDAAPARP